jgi:GTP-binding protein
VVYNQTNDPKVVQAAKTLFKNPCTFVAGVPDISFMRQFPFPEVAFWGRSNVGKSSLLNALIGTTIARTSNTPGRTQQLNFFNLGDKLMLVDMPGYGFANVPLKLKYQWEDLISAYLNERDQLKRVFLLIDARHGFLKNDIEIMKYLDELGCIYQILVTKADKISLSTHTHLKAAMEEELKNHSAARPEVILTSAERKQGIHELQQHIAAL